MDELRVTVESVFRREAGRITASLIRVSRSFDLAEEAMQDALATCASLFNAGWQHVKIRLRRSSFTGKLTSGSTSCLPVE